MRYLEHVDTEEIRRGPMTHGGWISVEDRLPEFGTYVLIYAEQVFVAARCRETYGYSWIDTWGNYLDEDGEPVPSHWMPLPAAPME